LGPFVDLCTFSLFSVFSLLSGFSCLSLSGLAGDLGFFKIPFLASFLTESPLKG
jgi:hypothetical protein